MAPTLPTFTPLEDSLWLTLCCRALDYRRPHPVLGDAMADQIVRTLDYDYRQQHVTSNFINNVALRAKKLDEVTAGFLARHPDAVGLDLGSGLDTRFDRLAPAPPPALVTARLEAHSGPGDIVLDLAGRGGWIAHSAIDHQRRAISIESSPLTQLLAELVLRPPDLRFHASECEPCWRQRVPTQR